MQRRKNNRKSNGKKTARKTNRRDIFAEDFFREEDGDFDEEDMDNVTDDTLEFLSLDDEMIEDYNRAHKRKESGRKASASKASEKGKVYEEIEEIYEDEEEYAAVYEDEEDDGYDGEEYEEEEDDGYGDEEYDEEDDGYGDEEYDEEDDGYDEEYDEEDEEYDDEDDEYEYGEYDDDEDYEYDEEERDGVIVRIRDFMTHMSTLDVVVAMLGIVVLAGVFLSGGLYLNARSVARQVDAFASVGEELAGISVIGESGLVAVSESAKLSNMIDLEEETPEEEVQEEIQEDQKKGVEVTLNLTSIQSDLKVKFVNKRTKPPAKYGRGSGYFLFQQLGQLIGSGYTAIALVILGKGDGQIRLHNKGGRQLKFIALVLAVDKFHLIGLPPGPLGDGLLVAGRLLGGGGPDIKLLIELLIRVADDVKGQVPWLHLSGQLHGVGLKHHQHLPAGGGDLLMLGLEQVDIILAHGTAVVAHKNHRSLSRHFFCCLTNGQPLLIGGLECKIRHLFANVQFRHKNLSFSILGRERSRSLQNHYIRIF